MKTRSKGADVGESDELFRYLIETQDYAIAILNPAGDVTNWNLGAQHIFGYTVDEIQGKSISTVYPQEQIKIVFEHLDDTTAKGRIEIETQLLKRDKSSFFANIIYTPLYKADGALRGFAFVTRDITFQKKLADENKILHDKLEERVRERTQELENVNKELNAFSYSISHDLRTPLRAISGFSKMLIEDYEAKLDAEGNRILNTIIENAEMMGQLIDDLLAFSRLSRLEVVDQNVDMKGLVQRCINDLLLVWPDKNYTITVAKLPSCNADPNMMKQVWMNLIENALKYSSKKDHSTIQIDFTEQENQYLYSITDNGAGFDMQYASKLFGVFQRMHSAEEFSGTGLGLALANRIIAKHGGRIWATSKVEEGATFYFTVPKIIPERISKQEFNI